MHQSQHLAAAGKTLESCFGLKVKSTPPVSAWVLLCTDFSGHF